MLVGCADAWPASVGVTDMPDTSASPLPPQSPTVPAASSSSPALTGTDLPEVSSCRSVHMLSCSNPLKMQPVSCHKHCGSTGAYQSWSCSNALDAEVEQQGHGLLRQPGVEDAAVCPTVRPCPGIRLWGLQPMPLGSSALRHHQLPAGAHIRFYRYLERSGHVDCTPVAFRHLLMATSVSMTVGT
jgi:hypothetical protein